MTYIANRLDLLQHAVDVILDTYGVTVSVEDKKKDLLKFGETADCQQTTTTLMTNQSGVDNENYVRRNLITHIASDQGADIMNITVEGHRVGLDISVSSLTQAAGTATCTTGTAHGFSTDEWVYVEGANESGYNGIVQVTVTGTTTFTYTVDAATASPATGTITVTSQNKTFTTQTVAISGTTKTALSTTLARATRAYVSEQNRAFNLVGNVYVAEDVTFTGGIPVAAQTHLMIPAGKSQSKKASTSLSNTDWFIMESIHGHIFTKAASAWADISLEVRKEGGVFREVDNIGVSSSSPNGIISFAPFLIAPANSDIRLVGRADTNGRDVAGSIQGILATTI